MGGVTRRLPVYWNKGQQCATVVVLCAGIPFLDSAAEHITRKIEQFSPQDAANAVWAYARLFHYPNQAFLRVRCSPRKPRASRHLARAACVILACDIRCCAQHHAQYEIHDKP